MSGRNNYADNIAGQQQECLHNEASKCPHRQQSCMLLIVNVFFLTEQVFVVVVSFFCSIFTF